MRPLTDAERVVPVLTHVVSQTPLLTVSTQYSYDVALVDDPHDRLSVVARPVALFAGEVLLNEPGTGGATVVKAHQVPVLASVLPPVLTARTCHSYLVL